LGEFTNSNYKLIVDELKKLLNQLNRRIIYVVPPNFDNGLKKVTKFIQTYFL